MRTEDCPASPIRNPRSWKQSVLMRIVDIRERTAPIASPIANAFIDFSKMTLSLVAVVTDVIRDGKPVIGYGFNSNGRYGQGGLIRERFAPRILAAEPEACSTPTAAISTLTRSGRPCSPTRSPAVTASGRWPSAPSTWRCGTPSPRSPASRCFVCWRSAQGVHGRSAASSSMRPAVTTIPARASKAWRRRCRGISIAATRS